MFNSVTWLSHNLPHIIAWHGSRWTRSTLIGFCEGMQDKMTHELASKTKAWTTLRGRETVALGRELLGGNGIVSDFLVSIGLPFILPGKGCLLS